MNGYLNTKVNNIFGKYVRNIMKTNVCPAGNFRILDEKQDGGLTWHEAQTGVLPPGIKRIKIICPICKRRVTSVVHTCHDGCCIYHTLPAHKPRGWWKKGKKTRSVDMSRYNDIRKETV